MLRLRLELIFSTAAYRPWNSTKHQEPKSVFVEHPNKITSSHDSSQSSASAFEQDYNGLPLLYHRGLKAPRWMSWSDTNPGRRFYGCSNHKESGCRFFVWHDREMSRRAKDVIIQFRDTGRALKREFGTEK